MKNTPLIDVFAGAGGVGKTTVAAAQALSLADAGHRTLVMTFDPSRRLKDALGIGEGAATEEIEVQGTEGRLHASLLDAKTTFDSVVARYAPDDAVRQSILENRYYQQLAGSLAGILEYMAVERLYDVVEGGRYDRVVLDTPPVSQALDLLEAPARITGFLDSGAVRFATRGWFDPAGRLKGIGRLGPVGRRLEAYLDDVVGLDLLHDLVDFFTAFKPLFEGFRGRALEVEELLRRPETRFSLVTTPSEDRTQDMLFFARRLTEAGLHLERVVLNRLHQPAGDEADGSELERLARRVTERESRAVATVKDLLAAAARLETLPLLADEPVDLAGLRRLHSLRSAG